MVLLPLLGFPSKVGLSRDAGEFVPAELQSGIYHINDQWVLVLQPSPLALRVPTQK